MVAWGDNSLGQVTPPAGLSGVVGIAAGYFHSLALKSDGTVVGWGDNSLGQLTPLPGLKGGIRDRDGTVSQSGGSWTATSLTVSPDCGYAGTPVTATGNGFLPGETVEISYRNARVSVPIGTGTADSNGTATVMQRVPSAPYGVYALYATGLSSGSYALASFSVTPRLIVNPNEGTPGSTPSVQGYGFGAGEAVNVYWNYPRRLLGTATADGLGRFLPLTFQIPGASSPGDNLLIAKGQNTLATVEGHITVE
ncbi:MAG: RCC1 domain-containing protein [Bryobacteraceae bacterium]